MDDAHPSSLRPAVCLSMIVRNEAHVIRRCLESVLPYLTHWVVVDTGSTDATRDIVRECLSGLPGRLHVRSWQDFAHNRNEALALSRELLHDHALPDGHLLVIDADEVWEGPPERELLTLHADVYRVRHRVADTSITFLLATVFRASLPVRYEGVVHEVLCHSPVIQPQVLPGVTIRGFFDSARNKGPAKYARDAELLECALLDDPDNPRLTFYLAQSYRDSNELEKSIAAYRRRVELGGSEEEVWYSIFQIGALQQRLQHDGEAIIAYLQAHTRRITRAEPLIALAAMFRARQWWGPAHEFASKALALPRPDDLLFLDESAYTWRPLDEYAIACFWIGQREKSRHMHRLLLEHPDLPESERARVESNFRLCT